MSVTKPRIFESEKYGKLGVIMYLDENIYMIKGETEARNSYRVRVLFLDKEDYFIEFFLDNNLDGYEASVQFSELNVGHIEGVILIRETADSMTFQIIENASIELDFSKDDYRSYDAHPGGGE